MSFDQYHFHMVLRQETMTHSERLEADATAARIVHWAARLVGAFRNVAMPRRSS